MKKVVKPRKPERLDHRNKEGNLITSSERDMYNQGLEDMETYQKGQRPTVEEINLCPPNCEFLTFTEEEQNKLSIENLHHICKAFDCRVYHYSKHPRICRYHKCFKIAQAIHDLYEEGMRGKG